MATQTLTAMFSTQAEAERAGQMLVSEMQVDRSMVRVIPGQASGMSQGASNPYDEKGLFGSLKDLFVPDEDRYTYAEGMRRGAVLMTVRVEEGQVGQASQIIERAGALDLDAQEASWRQSGWTGYDAKAHATSMGTAGAATGQDDTIKVVEERLVVGKRAVQGGNVRVRAYVVETPVEAQVTLREETVHLERHPVDRPATAADLSGFQERTIEMTETDEVAVVAKDVRVVEEIGIRKDATDRVETVRDTVRKTEVDVEDTLATSRAAGTTGVSGSMGTTGTTAAGAAGMGSNSPGTMASRAVDQVAGTNISGANPAGSAPDGTPGNPSGTMASRAVDKTLDTNISGANPAGSAPDGTPGNPPGTMASRAVDKALDTNISGANPGGKN